MITNWYITGDKHSNLKSLYNFGDENSAVIILGDTGINTGFSQDKYLKSKLCNHYKGHIYCVLGNHELRPSDVPGMLTMWDSEVSGEVYYQPQWPHIKYFKEYGIYWINKMRVMVIGGAYSVDKEYRLLMNGFWNPKEQLSAKEMEDALNMVKFQKFDAILSHTCPYSDMPTELFLPYFDQSKVDKTMEHWMDEVKQNCEYKKWYFGHYHGEKEADKLIMLYHSIIPFGKED